MRKRTFVSGYPWWFITGFLIVWGFFALVSLELPSRGLQLMFQFTLTAVIIGIFMYRLSSPQVYLCEGFLQISRCGRTVKVPLEQVAGLEETTGRWPFRRYSAVLHFSTDTPFGRSLYLGSFGSVPSMTLPWGVAELRQALDKVATKAMPRTPKASGVADLGSR